MMNIFLKSSTQGAKLPYFALHMICDNWLLLLIFNFPSLQCIPLNIWLLLHQKFETTSKQPIYLIDSQAHDPHHSWSDCLNYHHYWSLTYFF